jgi:predicted DNA-binding transcriptional regulator AlpA
MPINLIKNDLSQLVNSVANEVLQRLVSLTDQRNSTKHNQSLGNRYLRLKQILGDPKADPSIAPILPISKSSWYAGIKLGRYPHGIKISPRTTVWLADDVFAIAAHQGQGMGGCDED